MGTSQAFLTELEAQRAQALTQLHAAQSAGDDAEAALATARLRDLDELLQRSAPSDVHHDAGPVEVTLDVDRAAEQDVRAAECAVDAG